jgi:hypothetical protein
MAGVRLISPALHTSRGWPTQEIAVVQQVELGIAVGAHELREILGGHGKPWASDHCSSVLASPPGCQAKNTMAT